MNLLGFRAAAPKFQLLIRADAQNTSLLEYDIFPGGDELISPQLGEDALLADGVFLPFGSVLGFSKEMVG